MVLVMQYKYYKGDNMKNLFKYLNTIFAQVAFAEEGCLIHDFQYEKSFNVKHPTKVERVDIHKCKVCSKRLHKTIRVE